MGQHWDLITPMIGPNVLNRGPSGFISPAGQLQQPLQVNIGSDHHCFQRTNLSERACHC